MCTSLQANETVLLVFCFVLLFCNKPLFLLINHCQCNMHLMLNITHMLWTVINVFIFFFLSWRMLPSHLMEVGRWTLQKLPYWFKDQHACTVERWEGWIKRICFLTFWVLGTKIYPFIPQIHGICQWILISPYNDIRHYRFMKLMKENLGQHNACKRPYNELVCKKIHKSMQQRHTQDTIIQWHAKIMGKLFIIVYETQHPHASTVQQFDMAPVVRSKEILSHDISITVHSLLILLKDLYLQIDLSTTSDKC